MSMAVALMCSSKLNRSKQIITILTPTTIQHGATVKKVESIGYKLAEQVINNILFKVYFARVCYILSPIDQFIVTFQID